MKIQHFFIGAKTPQVEILPLIDVVFLVLIAFIYASMFLTQNTGLPVNLPESSEANTETAAVLTLTITRQGDLYLDEQQVQFTGLDAILSDAKIAQPNVGLFVKADRNAHIDLLVKVMDIAHKSGMHGLTITADQNSNDDCPFFTEVA